MNKEQRQIKRHRAEQKVIAAVGRWYKGGKHQSFLWLDVSEAYIKLKMTIKATTGMQWTHSDRYWHYSDGEWTYASVTPVYGSSNKREGWSANVGRGEVFKKVEDAKKFVEKYLRGKKRSIKRQDVDS